MADKRDNLRPPWQPGQSGNPAGRPRGSVSLVALLRERLLEGEDANAIVASIIEDAKSGDTRARKLVLEYIDGKPREAEPISSDDPIQIVDDV